MVKLEIEVELFFFLAHSPDNSFLGFVVSGPVPEDAERLKKKPIGLVYGKDVEFWRVRVRRIILIERKRGYCMVERGYEFYRVSRVSAANGEQVRDTRELTKRRRRRQRRRYKTIGLVSKNNGSARSARAFYILLHFFAVIS